jgi:hypothetical protein
MPKPKTPAVYLDPGEESTPTAAAPAVEQITFQEGIFHLQGTPLSPFAVDRESAWHLHRAQLSAPPVQQLGTLGEWGQDAIRILWFCSHEPSDWINAPMGQRVDGQWVRYTPEQRAANLEIKMTEWSQSALAGSALPEIVNLALAILASASKNRAVPIASGKGGTPSGN